MRRLAAMLFGLLLSGNCWGGLVALTYHDVSSDPAKAAFAVSRQDFAEQIEFLLAHGYRPVSLDFLSKVRRGQASLPEKAVLLTFDDAYQSYHDFVYPLLKRYGIPSVLAVVTGWQDGLRPPEYAAKLMTWNELRELNRSPLVEIVTHSHDLHHSIRSDPEGNVAYAGSSRRYETQSGYESEPQFRARLRRDLETSVARLKQEGITARGVAWPYGAYDNVLVEEAQRLGLEFQLSLDDGLTTGADLTRINRILVSPGMGIRGFSRALLGTDWTGEPLRFVGIRLDDIAHADPRHQEQNLSRALDRIKALGVNAVLVSPFTADLKAAYFLNRQMPVKADLLNQFLQQVRDRTLVRHTFLELLTPPAVTDVDTLYTQLMHRAGWFRGVVFSTATPAEQLARYQALFRNQRPTAKLGLLGKPGEAVSGVDFALVDVDAGLSERSLAEAGARAAAGGADKVLVRVRNMPATDDRRLARALLVLNAAGVRHLGYWYDDFAGKRPAVDAVRREVTVRELPL